MRSKYGVDSNGLRRPNPRGLIFDWHPRYSPISPMKALFWSAVINGVVAVPLMVVIIVLVSKKSVMGAFTASRSPVILGWIATAVMGAAAIRMFIPG
jgi:Mn2+/Fe2+ NRAMP family transporter